MTSLFGTDGIRARAGTFPLDRTTIPAIGWAIGKHLGSPILVGRDPRASGPWILGLLMRGLIRAGVEVIDGGVLPTPAVSLLTRQSEFRGGLMISASHNPFEDNGIKAFAANGQKLEEADEARIEARIADQAFPIESADSNLDLGNDRISNETESPLAQKYMALLGGQFPPGPWLEGIRIIVDCANGAMSQIAPALLRSKGAEVQPIHASPSGQNINSGCGAVDPASLIAHVRRDAPDLGVAFDGDGDRSIFVSSKGRLVDGDGLLYVMARHLRKEGRLEPPLVVGTSMTNFALEQAFRNEQIELKRVDVGDRHIFREMTSTRAQLGGEPSGHIIFSDHDLPGDGLLTTLHLCNTMIGHGASLDQLTDGWEAKPQLIRNLQVTEKVPLDTLPGVGRKVREIASELAESGRIVVRYSGTESVLRIMIESDSAATNDAYADQLTGVVLDSLPKP